MPQTELGYVVLKGDERRALQQQIAFMRAEFEIQYEGQRIEPFDAAWVKRQARRYRPDVYVSSEFVRQPGVGCLPRSATVREFGNVQPLPAHALPSRAD